MRGTLHVPIRHWLTNKSDQQTVYNIILQLNFKTQNYTNPWPMCYVA